MTLPDNGYELLGMDPEFTGSCPCATIRYEGGIYQAHCWRICKDCNGCGLHHEGDKATAEAMAQLLTGMDWYGEWQVKDWLLYDEKD